MHAEVLRVRLEITFPVPPPSDKKFENKLMCKIENMKFSVVIYDPQRMSEILTPRQGQIF